MHTFFKIVGLCFIVSTSDSNCIATLVVYP